MNYLHKNHHRCLWKMPIPWANSRPIWFPGAHEFAVLTVPQGSLYTLKFENHCHRQPTNLQWVTPILSESSQKHWTNIPELGSRLPCRPSSFVKSPVSLLLHTLLVSLKKKVKHKKKTSAPVKNSTVHFSSFQIKRSQAPLISLAN